MRNKRGVKNIKKYRRIFNIRYEKKRKNRRVMDKRRKNGKKERETERIKDFSKS